MPAGPVKKLTCTRSSPLLYVGALNLPRKKSSTPLPSGCVELPTTMSAARSTRDADIDAGCVAATPATVVATPTAATPSTTLRARFPLTLSIAGVLPKSRLATYSLARVLGVVFAAAAMTRTFVIKNICSLHVNALGGRRRPGRPTQGLRIVWREGADVAICTARHEVWDTHRAHLEGRVIQQCDTCGSTLTERSNCDGGYRSSVRYGWVFGSMSKPRITFIGRPDRTRPPTSFRRP